MNRILLVFFISCLIFSCAKIVTPSGGAKDSIPPVMLKSKPEANSTNFSGKEIDIVFDEFIVLDNPTQKILISPQITPAPEIMADLKTIKIKGIDSLRENTTYIIDFAIGVRLNASKTLPSYHIVSIFSPVEKAKEKPFKRFPSL